MRNVAIDQLRGIAVIMILFGHAPGLPLLKLNCGVHLFFVISGFLVTNSLYRLPVREFLSRRFWRTIPSAVLWFIGPLMISSHTVSEMWQHMSLRHNYPGIMMLGPYWSLMIEWQFYLVMPLIFALGGRAKTFVGLLIAFTLYRWYAVPHETVWQYVYLNTEFRVDSILWGILLALFVKTYPQTFSVPSFLNWAVFLTGVAFYFKGESLVSPWAVQPILNLFWVVLVYLAAVSPNAESNAISFIGKRCLSFYLVNNPIAYATPSVLLYFVIVFPLAILNYHLVETK